MSTECWPQARPSSKPPFAFFSPPPASVSDLRKLRHRGQGPAGRSDLPPTRLWKPHSKPLPDAPLLRRSLRDCEPHLCPLLPARPSPWGCHSSHRRLAYAKAKAEPGEGAGEALQGEVLGTELAGSRDSARTGVGRQESSRGPPLGADSM